MKNIIWKTTNFALNLINFNALLQKNSMPYIPRKAITRTCVECGSTMKVRNTRRIYCSDSCRVTAHYKRKGYPKYRPVTQQAQIPENIVKELQNIREELKSQKNLTNTLQATILSNLGSIVSIIQNARQNASMEEKHAETINQLNNIMHEFKHIHQKMDIQNQNDTAFLNNIHRLNDIIQTVLTPTEHDRLQLTSIERKRLYNNTR